MTMATTQKPQTGKADNVARKDSPSNASGNNGLKEYLLGVKSEFKKIVWPSRPQIMAQTLVVIFMTALMTLVLWGIDSTFRLAIGFITPHHGP
jgi:preprotein translocase subunit SecE